MNRVTVTNDFGETQTFKVGDTVGFKYDIEQIGRIKSIRRRNSWGVPVLLVENPNGFPGDYARYAKELEIDASRCFVIKES